MYWQYIVGCAVATGASIPLLLLILTIKYPWLKYDWKTLTHLGPVLRTLKKYERQKKSFVDHFEIWADKVPEKTFLAFQDKTYSYAETENDINKVANAAVKLNLKMRETVAVLMFNEPAFIWTFLGLSKIGVEPAFLNFNLRSKSLLHCFNVSGARTLIVGQDEELIQNIVEIYPELQKENIAVYCWANDKLPDGFRSFWAPYREAPESRPDRKTYRGTITHTDMLCYIYTSGTTGLPKAARVSHSKGSKATQLMTPVGVNFDDIIYTPLPLYHSAAGLVALGTVIEKGATIALRNKFSATHFWEDCRKYDVTVIQYIGELCRYLLARPKSPDDKNHKVRVAYGNGLRMDIWKEFQERFDIPIIGEFYAATEGNGGFINFFNKVGSIGRCSPLWSLVYPTYFIKYDFETAQPVRGEDGFCVKVKIGEPGLMVCRIKRDFEFDGYKGNLDLTKQKVIHNVFKKGDKYFNSGDLMVLDKDYFMYFSDRIGDTFRWKGENVATIEVSNVIADLLWIEDASVFGVEVPGQDGRAGMASVVMMKDHKLSESNLQELYKQCSDLLPAYARPRFLRFQTELIVTATLKQRKIELVEAGFNPDKSKGDPLYCIDFVKKTYVPLDMQLYKSIEGGSLRL